MKTNDYQLQQDVADELLFDPAVHASEIGVSVRDGVVTLSGEVCSYAEKIAAEKAAKRVRNVKAVAAELKVKYSFATSKSDTDIAGAAQHALQWNSFVPQDKITLEVNDGWITLEGKVDWQFERREAEDAVKYLTGVTGVTNKITLASEQAKGIVKDSLKKAFERNADLEVNAIEVIATGNKITLKGKVHSWRERNEAERIAWATPGVLQVEDDLVISTL